MRLILVAICLVLAYIHGSDAKWRDVNKCGTSIYPDAGEGLDPLGRIVNGEDAREYEFPYQVALANNTDGGIFCGAALITYRWIVTAAHCVYNVDTAAEFNSGYEIRIGEFHTNITDVKEKIRKADKLIIHDGFDIGTVQNDIALIRMNRRVGKAQGRIVPICRPEVGEDYVDSTAIVSGWGILSIVYPFPYPGVLQYVPLVILTNTECLIRFPASLLIDSMVCTSDGQNDDNRDSCYGESGGPMAVKVDGHFQLVGLVSFGDGCGEGTPGVNSRVSSFLEWIDMNL